MTKSNRFSGVKVFITGGSSGIGKEIANQLLQQGAQVAIAANNAQKLEDARREFEAIGGAVDTYCCDVASIAEVRAAVHEYVASHGAPDVVINNAGYAVYEPFANTETEEIERLIRVNFAGACIVTREFLPYLIEARSGSICVVASIAGRIPMTPCGIYSACKHGLVTWAQLMKIELKRFNISVSVVCPGRVETDFFSHPSFVRRTRRRETEWTIPVETVARACLQAIARRRFLTYVPRSYALAAWACRAFPFLFMPALEHVLESRIESIYALESANPQDRKA